MNLLTLQEGKSAPLLQGESLPAGAYEWIRLMIDTAGTGDTYMDMNGTPYELFVPSGAQTGLKLVGGFNIAAGASADFTIDFDLRKSIVERGQSGQDYILKPTLRIVDNTKVGAIAGTVDSTLLTDASCSADKYAVYVYSGAGAAVDDLGSTDEPLSSATVSDGDNDGTYTYRAAFLSEGDYTVAFTCQAGNDDPAKDQIAGYAADADVVFVGEPQNVTVLANTDSTADF